MDERDELSYLLARTALRDQKAFALLYERTSAKLFGVCLRILKTPSDAEEVLQEAYIKIWQNAGRYDTQVARPITWLATIARNQSLDRLRTRKLPAVEIKEGFDVPDPGPTPEQSAVLTADVVRLEACLSELDVAHATAIRRAYLDGWTYQQIADGLKVPLNTVKTWLRRSLMKLGDCLRR